MQEMPVSSGFIAFSPVRGKALAFGNGSDYFMWIVNGSHRLVQLRRDKDATRAPMASKKSDKKPIALKVPAEYALGAPDFGQPELFEYVLPEFVKVQLEAVVHFKIDARAGKYPKHEQLAAWFTTRRLSDGRLISPRQANTLATYCRPVGAMKGGNS